MPDLSDEVEEELERGICPGCSADITDIDFSEETGECVFCDVEAQYE